MAGPLNLSLVMRADASGLKGEVRAAGAELKGLGSSAKAAAGTASTSFENFSRKLRGAAANIAHQVQDIAGQLSAGISPITVLAQQGPQLLSAFGPQGAIVGGVLAGALAIGKAFLSRSPRSSASTRSCATGSCVPPRRARGATSAFICRALARRVWP